MKSAFSWGWDTAKKRYPKPPGTTAPEPPAMPQRFSEAERESAKAGYAAWCSGKYRDAKKPPGQEPR